MTYFPPYPSFIFRDRFKAVVPNLGYVRNLKGYAKSSFFYDIEQFLLSGGSYIFLPCLWVREHIKVGNHCFIRFPLSPLEKPFISKPVLLSAPIPNFFFRHCLICVMAFPVFWKTISGKWCPRRLIWADIKVITISGWFSYPWSNEEVNTVSCKMTSQCTPSIPSKPGVGNYFCSRATIRLNLCPTGQISSKEAIQS